SAVTAEPYRPGAHQGAAAAPAKVGMNRCDVRHYPATSGNGAGFCQRDNFDVLSLSRHVPFRSSSATRRVALRRGAEAPGQRTARGRLLRRVRRLVALAKRAIRQRLINDDLIRGHADYLTY